MELQSTKDKLLERVTGDNAVFLKRYELLRNGVIELQRVNPTKREIPYLDLLNYMMQNGKIQNNKIQLGVGMRNLTGTALLADIVRKNLLGGGTNKWLRNINIAKRKFFTEMLDALQDFKSATKMSEEGYFIDPPLVLRLLEKVSLDSISYLRGKQVSVIQTVLINSQSKEQIAIMNKIEDLEKKIDLILKFANTPTNRELKLQDFVLNY
jgi:hypothetical protein